MCLLYNETRYQLDSLTFIMINHHFNILPDSDPISQLSGYPKIFLFSISRVDVMCMLQDIFCV